MSDQSKAETERFQYVKIGFQYLISHGVYLLLPPMIVLLAARLSTLSLDDVYNVLWDQNTLVVIVVVCAALFVLFARNNRPVYLLEYSAYKADDDKKITKKYAMQRFKATGEYTPETVEFLKKVLERSAISDQTYLPDVYHTDVCKPSLAEARREAQIVLFGAMDDLLAKTGLKPKDIGILVVNCGMFDPTPSVSAMLVNQYKLREDILTYNIAGMGCSAGLIAIDLARQLLQVYPNKYAVVLTMENSTLNWYLGNDRSMLLPNCLFRMGGSATLLSNKASDRRRAKYELVRTLRTHKGADDKSYYSIYQQEDEKGVKGVTLSKDLISVAGEALKSHITALGPMVLPLSEQFLFVASLFARKILKMKMKPYTPDFKSAFHHFCIHPGGRAVLDAVEKNLGLSKWLMEPSRMTLYRFGNTSNSAFSYELAYLEAQGRIKKGELVWNVAFGSGFKVSTVVWRALRTIDPAKEKNPWTDEIHQFPVDIPKIVDLS